MSQPTEPRTTRPTDQRPTLSRRHALGGVAGVGLGLPLLAACGGDDSSATDPAGGSWYVEDLTDRLAEAAWERFRSIEADGGVLAALASGRVAAEVDATRSAGVARLATRAEGITGVTEFPDLDEAALDRAPGPAAPDGPFAPVRPAAPFEDLRDAGEAAAAEARLDASRGVHGPTTRGVSPVPRRLIACPPDRLPARPADRCPTVPSRGRSRPSRASTGSGTPSAG